MKTPAVARELFGEPLLRRQEDGTCALTRSGRQAVADHRLSRGEIVTLDDVGSALGLHPRTVLRDVVDGKLTATTTGTHRLYFELGDAAAYVMALRGEVTS